MVLFVVLPKVTRCQCHCDYDQCTNPAKNKQTFATPVASPTCLSMSMSYWANRWRNRHCHSRMRSRSRTCIIKFPLFTDFQNNATCIQYIVTESFDANVELE
jgi:hypothetical protein